MYTIQSRNTYRDAKWRRDTEKRDYRRAVTTALEFQLDFDTIEHRIINEEGLMVAHFPALSRLGDRDV